MASTSTELGMPILDPATNDINFNLATVGFPLGGVLVLSAILPTLYLILVGLIGGIVMLVAIVVAVSGAFQPDGFSLSGIQFSDIFIGFLMFCGVGLFWKVAGFNVGD